LVSNHKQVIHGEAAREKDAPQAKGGKKASDIARRDGASGAIMQAESLWVRTMTPRLLKKASK
jgi:hypothetical protein